jgi:hypothetical protein
MRKLIITESDLGPRSLFTVETSAGVRSSGATVQSALQKLDLTGLTQQSDFDSLASVFEAIRPTGGDSQIREGVQS